MQVFVDIGTYNGLFEKTIDADGLKIDYTKSIGTYVTVLIVKAHRKHQGNTDTTRKSLNSIAKDVLNTLEAPIKVSKEDAFPLEVLERVGNVVGFRF